MFAKRLIGGYSKVSFSVIGTISRRNFGGRSERVAFAMSKLARSLDKAEIDYCVMGGNALHAHGYERATVDVDVLMTKDGLARFVETHVGRGYAPRFLGAKTKFRNTADDVPIDILLTGAYPGENQVEVPFPEPKEISYEESFFGTGNSEQIIRMVDLKNLINFKLLAYKDLPRERIQDYVDVRMLIKNNPLDAEKFVKHLHSSVHELFKEAVVDVENMRRKELEED
mmetsp:Transcript_122522/g.342904  ORF Transcript_122522/g.342904 Transcript_122522/m.342904 type:complete len:227 (+) Transcript_122522:102-782(+)|eukprot:CAMPEP_0176221860 /NCGR_PEP_ID=MMETSP0121_2-20121125/19939_1 /TAXON_ID=160619 /ORGANISM="Kryptoperidinium foliaceum, Strain CCMP 1326" /LENGTH=226 /DNA_ID=CAMNT_0017561061 /DNA_START=92 /DNA_END=772 /DNA_ORIENTATION=+